MKKSFVNIFVKSLNLSFAKKGKFTNAVIFDDLSDDEQIHQVHLLQNGHFLKEKGFYFNCNFSSQNKGNKF